jgi:hypothetical protein
MASIAAEIARTLASGRLPGMIAVAGLRAGCIPVVHAADDAGRILIAAPRESQVWQVLSEVGDQASAVLSVVDVPPLPDSPHLGVVWVAGWVTRLADVDAQAAAVEFAAANPVDLLLDVGRGTDLFGLSAEEVRVELRRETTIVDVDDFAAARPDPFQVDEHDLLVDLREHHGAEIASLLSVPEGEAQVVRLSRHGVIVRLRSGRLVNLEFHSPAHGSCCVARALGLGQRS